VSIELLFPIIETSISIIRFSHVLVNVLAGAAAISSNLLRHCATSDIYIPRQLTFSKSFFHVTGSSSCLSTHRSGIQWYSRAAASRHAHRSTRDPRTRAAPQPHITPMKHSGRRAVREDPFSSMLDEGKRAEPGSFPGTLERAKRERDQTFRDGERPVLDCSSARLWIPLAPGYLSAHTTTPSVWITRC